MPILLTISHIPLFTVSSIIHIICNIIKLQSLKDLIITKNIVDISLSLQLKYTDLENFSKIPPSLVLEDIKKAKERNIFEKFQIIEVIYAPHVELPIEQKEAEDVIRREIESKKDPLVVGIKDNEYYFISQWSNDISLNWVLNVK